MIERIPYLEAVITRVKLEDRAVVAQTACKDSLDTSACAQQRWDCVIEDEFGSCVKSNSVVGPGFDLSPS